MKITTTAIDGVLVIEPRVFGDPRGFFLESFNARDFAGATGRHVEFVQDNQSRSTRGVLRGLHWQEAPHAQGKLVRVVSGAVFDVAVDIRRASPTFGRWIGVELSGDNHCQIWIEPGLAHGFLVLSETADVLYKTTTYYAPAAERSIRFDDPDLAIAWPDVGMAPTVSAKDTAGMSFAAWRAEASAR
ncbi:MAG TPA: dTDP-4-dehydrorhamnose 3,5-epimerase [Caldimonas sp.]|nr:dTDP-4-dehydrorhamnose 3,5-epimerase [Caldimonas sp.]